MKKNILSLVLVSLLTGCNITINNNYGNTSNSSTSTSSNKVIVSSSIENKDSSSSIVSSSSSTSSKYNKPEDQGIIKIWVGYDQVTFYAQQLAEYIEENPDFPHYFYIEGVDVGMSASTFLADKAAGADIFTISHDNIGKLTAGTPVIAPISDKGLLDQIEADNIDAFKDVIKDKVGGKEYTFAVPYISQALVLYYNKSKVTAEQAKTWEGLMEAAKAAGANVKATTTVGTDLYNFSWPLLSTEVGTGKTTVELYKNASAENCKVTGDDTVAIMKWTQDFYANPNGGKYLVYSTWEQEVRASNVLSVVGGPWNFNAAKYAFGENNVGITTLPTFTITEDYGSVKAGTQFQAGCYTDCKAFVMKKGSPYGRYLNDVVKFLSSKEVQEKAYEECNNLPAYKNAIEEFEAIQADTVEAKLAQAQINMFEHGIAQPFGYDTSFIDNYYSPRVSTLYNFIVTNDDGSVSTYEVIKAELQSIETYLKTGR